MCQPMFHSIGWYTCTKINFKLPKDSTVDPQFWLVWVEVCRIFLESQHRQNYCFWGHMCVLACRLKLKWFQDTSIRTVFTWFVCVDDVVTLGVEPWRGCKFYFSRGTLSCRESSLVQTFYESCVHLDITNPPIHMTRRFVSQGCPTL